MSGGPLDFALILPPDGARGTRLLEALREAIFSSRLGPGERLPPSRALAAQLGISRGTVVEAYDELVGEGYCAARVGAGTFVTMTSPPRRPDVVSAPARLSGWGRRLPSPESPETETVPVQYDFRSGLALETFPGVALGRALRRAADRLVAVHGAGDAAGSPRLRAAIAAYLARARAVRADPSQVIIVSGTQQALDLATRLLIDAGDRVCVEDPGYPKALTVLRALGANLVPVPVDREGLRVSDLPANGASMVYVTPSHQYPTGAVLSPERRLVLHDWAAEHDAWLLEDDYDSEFRYSGPPLPSLQGLDRAGRSLYLGSLSKLLHPALRAGYLVAPPALVSAAIAAKSSLDQATTPVVQEALADLFESGEIERHLQRASRAYRLRRGRLLAAFASHLPSTVDVWPVTGGLHAYIEVPGVDSARLQHHARSRGVAVLDATGYHRSPPPAAALVLWFSRIAPELIEPGIVALAEAIRGASAS